MGRNVLLMGVGMKIGDANLIKQQLIKPTLQFLQLDVLQLCQQIVIPNILDYADFDFSSNFKVSLDWWRFGLGETVWTPVALEWTLLQEINM